MVDAGEPAEGGLHIGKARIVFEAKPHEDRKRLEGDGVKPDNARRTVCDPAALAATSAAHAVMPIAQGVKRPYRRAVVGHVGKRILAERILAEDAIAVEAGLARLRRMLERRRHLALHRRSKVCALMLGQVLLELLERRAEDARAGERVELRADRADWVAAQRQDVLRDLA